jgi:hypothetical protein
VSQRCLALDPGNSTGWVIRDYDGKLYGGTIGECHKAVYELLCIWNPEVIVYETFQMYPGKAQKLIWNTFYPVEVIGVIKLWHMMHPVYTDYDLTTQMGDIVSCSRKLVGLQPSVKKYALSNNELDLWKTVDRKGQAATEHLRDAVRLLRYYERNPQ